MPIEDKKPKNDPLIDVGEKEGAEIELDNNEQVKAAAEEKKEEKIEVPRSNLARNLSVYPSSQRSRSLT